MELFRFTKKRDVQRLENEKVSMWQRKLIKKKNKFKNYQNKITN